MGFLTERGEMSYRYTVRAAFQHAATANEWVNWLQTSHCQEVLDSGALSYEILALDSEEQTFEVRYIFANRNAFATYENDHAERLRADGLERFPTARGIAYTRSTGYLLARSRESNTL